MPRVPRAICAARSFPFPSSFGRRAAACLTPFDGRRCCGPIRAKQDEPVGEVRKLHSRENADEASGRPRYLYGIEGTALVLLAAQVLAPFCLFVAFQVEPLMWSSLGFGFESGELLFDLILGLRLPATVVWAVYVVVSKRLRVTLDR